MIQPLKYNLQNMAKISCAPLLNHILYATPSLTALQVKQNS